MSQGHGHLKVEAEIGSIQGEHKSQELKETKWLLWGASGGSLTLETLDSVLPILRTIKQYIPKV